MARSERIEKAAQDLLNYEDADVAPPEEWFGVISRLRTALALPPDAPGSAEAKQAGYRLGKEEERESLKVVRAEMLADAERRIRHAREAMREAAAKVAESFRGPSPNPDDRPGTWLLRQAENIAAKIRALPTPAATCETCGGGEYRALHVPGYHTKDCPKRFKEPDCATPEDKPDKAGEAERRFLEAARETDRLRRQYPGRPLNDPERPKLLQRIDQAKRKERKLRHEWSIALRAAEGKSDA